MNLIAQLEQEEIARLGKTLPSFAPGDTVVVQVKVKEGTRERLQAYEGVVIAKRNRGLNSSFIVRKISAGEGVERTFQTYSPLVASVEVKRRGDVRRRPIEGRPRSQSGVPSRHAALDPSRDGEKTPQSPAVPGWPPPLAWPSMTEPRRAPARTCAGTCT